MRPLTLTKTDSIAKAFGSKWKSKNNWSWAKSQIESYGVDKFVHTCKQRVLKYAAIQTEQSIRLGYWMEWDNPQQLRKLAAAIGTDDSRSIFAAQDAVGGAGL